LTGCQARNTTAVEQPAVMLSQQVALHATEEPLSTRTPLQPLPSATVDPTQACVQAGGHVESFSIESELIPKPLDVLVYFPPCYNLQDPASFPLLVLLHGQSYSESQWSDLGAVETANRLIAAGEMPPLLIAMPHEEYDLQDPMESYFGEALVDVLMPWMEENLHASGTSSCHALGGISRGAAWAVHIGFREWETFSIIGAHSVPPFPSDRYRAPYWKQNIPADRMPALSIDIGESDPYLTYAEEFHRVLEEYEVSHEWHLNQGGHNNAYWEEHLEEYFLWYGMQLWSCADN